MDTKLKTYETICLTKVDMPDDKFAAMVDRCKASIANEGKGEFLYMDDWGKNKISYKIGKDTRAKWTYLRYKSESAGVDELLRSLSINEFVLRQMTCRTTEDGSDFNAYREAIAKDIAERGERRDWKDERPSRYGSRREGGGGYDRYDRYERGGDRNDQYAGGADQGGDVEGQANESGEN